MGRVCKMVQSEGSKKGEMGNEKDAGCQRLRGNANGVKRFREATQKDLHTEGSWG